jgi:predicted enzyme related to lactoylglutathione lyase
MNTSSIALSVEVITLPVSDVERALRFYVDQVGFTLDVDYSPTDAFRVVQLTPPGSSCSIQIGSGLTDAPVGSLRNVYLVVTDLEAARSRLLERGVEVGEIRQRHPLMPGTEVSHPGSTPRAGTTPASPTSRTRMATAGCYRNGATAMCDVVWKLCDVDHARR